MLEQARAMRRSAMCCAAILVFASCQMTNAETPQILSHAAAYEAADFDVYFPLRNKAELDQLILAQVDKSSTQYHKWLTPADFEARFGPAPETVARVTEELNGLGFHVAEHLGLMLHVNATAARVESVFGVTISHARFSEGTEKLVADGELLLTPALAASGARIAQFTTVAPFRRHSQIVPNNYNTAYGPYFAADLRQAYDYPSFASVNGVGIAIGILMSGGYNPTDIAGYFNSELVPAADYPKLQTVPINGGLAFSTSNSGETHLDIQQSAGMALGATEILYNLSDLSDDVVMYGLSRIVSDNKVSVVNMSFGEPEVDYFAANNGGISREYLLSIEDTLFQQGLSQGITFVASSGDHGSKPLSAPSGAPVLNVECPACDPYVLAVGGTNLVTTHVAGSNNSAYVKEFELPDTEPNGEVWASGGGISKIWLKPTYQTLVPTQSAKFRTVPDLALHMGGCPGDATNTCSGTRSADWVAIGGQLVGEIGTSASAPDIVGMLALAAKLTTGHRLGFVNTAIYQASQNQISNPTQIVFHHSAITGNNGTYYVKAPYDLVIGNGTIDARAFIQRITNTTLAPSGIPGTASNP